jgi:hypothetical protein
MPKYEVEFALFKTCIIEADSLEEAKDKSYTMEDDEIEETSTKTEGYMIWNDVSEFKINH